MRTLPTRRELVFVLAIVICLILFFQIALNSAADDTEHEYSHWGRKILPWKSFDVPIRNKNASSKPTPVLLQDGGENAVLWTNGDVPITKINIHVAGSTVFERLYIWNGTIYIVTDEPETIPDRRLLTSSGRPLANDPEGMLALSPSDVDLQIITPQQASDTFGSRAFLLDGASFIVTEAPQFVPHYYHWTAEIFLALWRAYSLLDQNIQPDGSTLLDPPRRLMLRHVQSNQWRDPPGMNQFVTRGVWPATAIEYADDWKDRALFAKPFILERAVVVDRAAARHSPTAAMTNKGWAALFKLPSSPHWWRTVRNNLIRSVGGDPFNTSGNVITYVSRQEWGRRALKPEDHDGLVAALRRLEKEYGFEVNIVSMEKMSREEQIRLAGRTTILMGVHGNGLTALMWMNLSKRATVMEFYYPPGFTYDYELLTRVLGMTHYGFWKDEYFTSPDTPPVHIPPGFHGNAIPIDGEAVAKLCLERLSIPED